VRIGYYAQSHEGLDFKKTVLEEILWTAPMSEGEGRSFLGRFLFSGDEVYKKVGELSGGERSRVALAKLTLAKANFLILDEPTNHLDISSREALEELLSEFNGTIMFVSHDRYFIDALATQVWELEGGSMAAYLGNYTDYLNWKSRQQDVADPPKNGKAAAPPPPKPVASSNGSVSKQQSQEEKKRQKKVADLELSISKLEEKLNTLSKEMNQASSRQDVEAISRLSIEYSKASEELDRLYAEWGVLAS
jgi:ATP-binding cassette subfamily F protein 3